MPFYYFNLIKIRFKWIKLISCYPHPLKFSNVMVKTAPDKRRQGVDSFFLYLEIAKKERHKFGVRSRTVFVVRWIRCVGRRLTTCILTHVLFFFGDQVVEIERAPLGVRISAGKDIRRTGKKKV